jgi:hypothetical protein
MTKEICTSDNRPSDCCQERPECKLGPVQKDGSRRCLGYLWRWPQVDLDPKFDKLISEHFWELV